MKDIFDELKTPKDLSVFMNKYINYGYLDKFGKVHHFDDEDFNDNWYDEYILESATDVLKTKFGNCFDQVELERDWFTNKRYIVKTFYEMVLLDYDNPYPTHAFLVYKDENNNWNWFENADFDNRGIHTYSSLDDLLKYQYTRYVDLLKKFNISKEELEKIILTEFDKPKIHSTANEYLEYVTNSKEYRIDR